jgi:hypothetical protein
MLKLITLTGIATPASVLPARPTRFGTSKGKLGSLENTRVCGSWAPPATQGKEQKSTNAKVIIRRIMGKLRRKGEGNHYKPAKIGGAKEFRFTDERSLPSKKPLVDVSSSFLPTIVLFFET